MDTVLVIVIIAVVALVLLGAAYWFVQSQNQKRTGELRGRYGSEYDRAVSEAGDRKRAEQELQEREKRVSRFQIKPLAETQRQEYSGRWRDVQARFVDDPAGAMTDADRLCNDVMTARGYPMGDWEQRAADVSVDHAQVVANYRAAHRIYEQHESGQSDTEQLRQAMVHYRALFDELLAPEPVGARS
jgi:hypothetical protein